MLKAIENEIQCTLNHNLHPLTTEGIQEYIISKSGDEDYLQKFADEEFVDFLEYYGDYSDFTEWHFDQQQLNKKFDLELEQTLLTNKQIDINFYSGKYFRFIKTENIIEKNSGVFVYLAEESSSTSCYFKLSDWNRGLYLVPILGISQRTYYSHNSLLKCNKLQLSFDLMRKLGIPSDLIQHTNFAGKYQLALIQWLSRSSAAIDLLNNNPVLLWIMLNWAEQHEPYKGKAKEVNGIIFDLLQFSQKKILQELFGTGTKSDIKFLRKLDTQAISHPSDEYNDNYERIVSVIHEVKSSSKLMKVINHWKVMPINRFDLLGSYFWNGYNPILKLFNHNQEFENLREIITMSEDSINMSRRINEQYYKRTYNRLLHATTATKIKEIHDNVLMEFNLQVEMRDSADVFIEPFPIPGNELILPILSRHELYNEGKIMHHCVGSYDNKMMNGNCWIYKVLKPERATLEIIPKNGGIIKHLLKNYSKDNHSEYASDYFIINQLYASCNKEVSPETRNSVQRWLNKTVLIKV